MDDLSAPPVSDNADDAGLAALHPSATAPPSAVGPTTTDYRNTLQPLAASTACVGIDTLQFQFASSFVKPSTSRSMAALAALLGPSGDHQGAFLSVFGHADRVGSDENNKRLSGRRAKAVYALLIQNTDVWEALYSKPIPSDTWNDSSIRTMLNHLGYTKPHLADAVSDFQTANSIPSDGDASSPSAKPTRAALFKQYMVKLSAGFTVPASQFLVGANDADTPGDVQGCSEFNPVWVPSQAEAARWDAGQDKVSRDQMDAPNRRVLVLLYKRKPDMSKWPCPPPETGTPTCRTQFGRDGDAHRNPDVNEKSRLNKDETFACLWYQRQAGRSPCERRGALDAIVFSVVNDSDGTPVEDGWVLQITRDGGPAEDTPLKKGRAKVLGRSGQVVRAVKLMRTPGTPEDIRTIVKVTQKTAAGATSVSVVGVSLDNLLAETMFGTAAGAGLGEDHLGDAMTTSVAASPSEWSWAHSAAGSAAVGAIKYDLPAGSPMGHAMTMDVLTAVLWHDVDIEALSPNNTVLPVQTLPLNKTFLMRRRRLLPGSSIAGGSTGWWQLPAKLDCCLMLAYGFEIDHIAGTIKEIPDAVQSSTTFMPSEAIDPRAEGTIGVHVEVEIRVVPLRVVVVAELMPCSLAADFEPFGVLDAARIFPLLLVRPSLPLKRINAQIDLVRPATSTMTMPPTSASISAGFFADSNDGRARPLAFLDKLPAALKISLPPALVGAASAQPPLWDALFDYYDTQPAMGATFKMVDWARAGRAVHDKVDMIDITGVTVLSTSPGVDASYVSTDFNKLAGQGEFDNVHMAPKMIYSKYPLVDVTMAPICAHDCFHTHWRWGALYSKVPSLSVSAKGLLGFDGFNPNHAAGAPMVPVNQTVEVQVLTASALKFKIKIEDQIGPSQWQVMMHHGSAYAVQLRKVSELGSTAAVYFAAFVEFALRLNGYTGPPLDLNNIPTDLWSAIYFTFRYQDFISHGTFMERVRVRDLPGARTG